MKFKKISALFITLSLVVASVFLPTSAQAYTISGFDIKSRNAVFASLDNGSVMYSKDADKKAYPASLTKVMTAIVSMENCDDLDAKITVPEDAISSLIGTGTTMGGLEEGEQISVRDLLKMLLVCSAADAANTLAKHFGGGNIQKFVDMMNAKAKSLKMDNTHFMNPHGLHDDNHYSTANDLLKMALYAYDIPGFMDICEEYVSTIPATNKTEQRTIVTTNYMINPNTDCYYKYARGIKTGFTTPAGRCLISTASKDGYNYICVLLGAEDTDNLADRNEFNDATNLFKWAFENFEHRQIVDSKKIVCEIPLRFAWDSDFLQLYPENNVYAVVPKNISDESLTYDTIFGSDRVNAPIKAGEVVGYARIICAGEEVGTVNLVAKDDVGINYLMFFKQVVDSLISSLAFKILLGGLLIAIVMLIVSNIAYKNKKHTRARRVNKIRKF